ncbi:hypothetical protein BTUL_0012g01200 [Botrytis tulipae]|uniref:Uncharacterized protein n=1 Tax=Botrytis tulipae TaxID=87230 RepID=A0A4Z1F0T1_9HELO|nr:hypothetical protein BTUL_0012g01200 [Botrytis tulipae]
MTQWRQLETTGKEHTNTRIWRFSGSVLGAMRAKLPYAIEQELSSQLNILMKENQLEDKYNSNCPQQTSSSKRPAKEDILQSNEPNTNKEQLMEITQIEQPRQHEVV